MRMVLAMTVWMGLLAGRAIGPAATATICSSIGASTSRAKHELEKLRMPPVMLQPAVAGLPNLVQLRTADFGLPTGSKNL
jgi:hypothetical protein